MYWFNLTWLFVLGQIVLFKENLTGSWHLEVWVDRIAFWKHYEPHPLRCQRRGNPQVVFSMRETALAIKLNRKKNLRFTSLSARHMSRSRQVQDKMFQLQHNPIPSPCEQSSKYITEVLGHIKPGTKTADQRHFSCQVQRNLLSITVINLPR